MSPVFPVSLSCWAPQGDSVQGINIQMAPMLWQAVHGDGLCCNTNSWLHLSPQGACSFWFTIIRKAVGRVRFNRRGTERGWDSRRCWLTGCIISSLMFILFNYLHASKSQTQLGIMFSRCPNRQIMTSLDFWYSITHIIFKSSEKQPFLIENQSGVCAGILKVCRYYYVYKHFSWCLFSLQDPVLVYCLGTMNPSSRWWESSLHNSHIQPADSPGLKNTRLTRSLGIFIYLSISNSEIEMFFGTSFTLMQAVKIVLVQTSVTLYKEGNMRLTWSEIH